MQAKMLSDAASQEDVLARRAGHLYFFNLFTVERLRNTTRASPLEPLDGRLEVGGRARGQHRTNASHGWWCPGGLPRLPC